MSVPETEVGHDSEGVPSGRVSCGIKRIEAALPPGPRQRVNDEVGAAGDAAELARLIDVWQLRAESWGREHPTGPATGDYDDAGQWTEAEDFLAALRAGQDG
jgi:hypothetical protein